LHGKAMVAAGANRTNGCGRCATHGRTGDPWRAGLGRVIPSYATRAAPVYDHATRGGNAPVMWARVPSAMPKIILPKGLQCMATGLMFDPFNALSHC
jgi:hypothetical protein